jgi:serine protease Do
MKRLFALTAALLPLLAGAQGFVSAVKAVEPALVSILTEKLKRTSAAQPGGAQTVPAEGIGSGVVIDTLGHILTCDHVVSGYMGFVVKFSDGQTYSTPDVLLTGRDPVTDIAVIQVKGRRGFVPARIGDSDELEVGQPVVALGSPYGLDNSASSGIVSAVSRWQMPKRSGPDFQAFIQTDATINPGNSGGPLVTLDGRVVGINSFVRTQKSGAPTGIGFAVPSDLALDVARQIIRNGYVVRGYLGINTQAVTPDLQQAFKLPSARGALVAQVMPRGPGAQAGIRPGDVILELGDSPVEGVREFQTMAAAVTPGTEIRLGVLRGGQRRTLTARFGEWPLPVETPRAVPVLKNWLGMGVTEIPAADRQKYGLRSGVVVTELEQGGPAADAGVKASDIILELGGRELSTAADYQALRQQFRPDGRPLLCRVLRGKEAFYTAIEY